MTGYAIFNPSSKAQKVHPEYGLCEAVYPDLTEEEAEAKLERFKSVNPNKEFFLVLWPSGERVGER